MKGVSCRNRKDSGKKRKRLYCLSASLISLPLGLYEGALLQGQDREEEVRAKRIIQIALVAEGLT